MAKQKKRPKDGCKGCGEIRPAGLRKLLRCACPVQDKGYGQSLDESWPLGKFESVEIMIWQVSKYGKSWPRVGVSWKLERVARLVLSCPGLACVFKMSFCCQPQTSCLVSNYNYGAMLLTTLTASPGRTKEQGARARNRNRNRSH